MMISGFVSALLLEGSCDTKVESVCHSCDSNEDDTGDIKGGTSTFQAVERKKPYVSSFFSLTEITKVHDIFILQLLVLRPRLLEKSSLP